MLTFRTSSHWDRILSDIEALLLALLLFARSTVFHHAGRRSVGRADMGGHPGNQLHRSGSGRLIRVCY